MSQLSRSLTYEELARELRIKPNSARQLVNRKRWMKRRGNDGRLRVDVPVEALCEAPQEALQEALHGASDVALHVAPHVAPREAPAIELLTRHVERLETALDAANARIGTLEQERDAERQRASDRDALVTQLNAEKRRADELQADRDRCHAHIERQEGEIAELRVKASERDALAVQIEALRGVVEEARADRDRWAVQAHVLAHPPVPPAPAPTPSRRFLGWFRAARR
jgi:DNA repair exonuclease SbcCD ATPase subunit